MFYISLFEDEINNEEALTEEFELEKISNTKEQIVEELKAAICNIYDCKTALEKVLKRFEAGDSESLDYLNTFSSRLTEGTSIRIMNAIILLKDEYKNKAGE